MTQQTAVEWLHERLSISLGDELKSLRGMFVIAREMEKEQIKSAFSIGMNSSVDYFDGVTDEDENYYNETFNK